MTINRNGSQPSLMAPADWFTDTVRSDSRFQDAEPARVAGAIVAFELGARTAWHTHPLGQMPIITCGTGRTQCEGESIVKIRAGDIIWCRPAKSAGKAPPRPWR
jgi:quercetin dioxygenase-like cupin family protein